MTTRMSERVERLAVRREDEVGEMEKLQEWGGEREMRGGLSTNTGGWVVTGLKIDPKVGKRRQE